MRPAAVNTLLLTAIVASLAGCWADGAAIRPAIWNQDVRLGETVILPFSTNANVAWDLDDPLASPTGPIPGANVSRISEENVRVQLEQPGTGIPAVEIAPLSVFEASASRTSAIATSFPGAWVAMVAFQVPPNLQTPAIPAVVNVKVSVDGTVGTLMAASPGRLNIIGVGGSPAGFIPQLADLQNPPMLRMRAKVGAGKFDADCVVGSIRFDLAYPPAVSDPYPYVNSEAYYGSVTSHTAQPNVARVVLIDSYGFVLQDADGNGVAGQGPLIDVVFTKLAPFVTADFQINNLVVTRPDGTVCVDQSSQQSTQAFELNVIRGS